MQRTKEPDPGPLESLRKRALESLPDAAVLVVDENMRIELSAGGVGAGVVDLSAIEGMPIGEALPFADQDQIAGACAEAIHGGDTSLEMELSDGHRFAARFVELGASPGEDPAALVLLSDVTETTRQHDAMQERAADLETISEAARALARSTYGDDARLTVCEAAVRVAQADIAILYEPHGSGAGLIATAAIPASCVGQSIPSAVRSAAWDAFSSGSACLIDDLDGRAQGEEEMIRQAGAAAALWQPVTRSMRVHGVIAVGWRTPNPHAATRAERSLGLIAPEAAVAIDRAAALDRLSGLARTDPLTEISNRRGLTEELTREVARASREGRSLPVALIDLDNFKAYNDSFGHPAGDRLLVTASTRWRRRLRLTDLLARTGGDEFAILMPGCPVEQTMALLERLRLSLPEGQTCSIGVAFWRRGESPETLWERADQALYSAKRGGRNRVFAAESAAVGGGAVRPVR